VTTYYKQSVYDASDKRIGEITDLLVQGDGRVAAVMVAVGGFLGIGGKDVAVAFYDVHQKRVDNKNFLVLDTTKEALKAAPGFRFDRTTARWVPEVKEPPRTQ